jgi:hypothetical protein
MEPLAGSSRIGQKFIWFDQATGCQSAYARRDIADALPGYPKKHAGTGELPGAIKIRSNLFLKLH